VRVIDPVKVGPLALLPGDIRLSEFEEFLSEAWTDSFKRRLGGLRATSSISNLVTEVSQNEHFDFVFYDTGPNIGPLNRILLLDSDFFIVPVACDLFSVRALSTLGQSLKRWIVDWKTIAGLAPDEADLLNGSPRFLGYIPQGFKVYGQTMAKSPARYLRQIKKKIYESITAVLREIDPQLAPPQTSDPMIGEVKNFSSLVQSAQGQGVALWDCAGGDPQQKQDAETAFAEIAASIIEATGAVAKSRGK
jgi:cellulose biosynthesis protein BcsQ